MVRRSSSTSRGTNYWFHCFCFPISRLSGLRKRNFPDLMCLPKSRETKTVKESYPTNVHCARRYDQSPFSGPPKVWNLSMSTRNPFPSVNNRTKQARFLQKYYLGSSYLLYAWIFEDIYQF